MHWLYEDPRISLDCCKQHLTLTSVGSVHVTLTQISDTIRTVGQAFKDATVTQGQEVCRDELRVYIPFFVIRGRSQVFI